MIADVLPLDTLPLTMGWGQKVRFHTVKSWSFELGHVAYQMKGTVEFSNMQAHILSIDTPSTPEMGSNSKTFFFLSESSRVAYQIKGMEPNVPFKHIFCAPGVESKSQNIFCESCHGVYQITGNGT